MNSQIFILYQSKEPVVHVFRYGNFQSLWPLLAEVIYCLETLITYEQLQLKIFSSIIKK